jgi:predicted methyltransferase
MGGISNAAGARMGAMRTNLALGLLASLSLLACASTEALPPETSVMPGINEAYLSGEFTVERGQRIFESESREIFRLHDELIEALELRPGMDVGDIGSGTGLFLEGLSKAVGDQGHVYAVDLTPHFVEHLEQRAAEDGLDNVSAVQCTERSVELPPGSIDLAFLCDVYHHFEYPQSSLASILSAMRPGGTLVVVDFERIPGVSRPWLLDHVRADKATFRAEIEQAGFTFEREVELEGLEENYVLRFVAR